MIVDRIRNCEKYRVLGERISVALDYLTSTDFSQLKIGEYGIDGEEVFAIVSDYSLKPRDEGRLEAHREYIDIQYLAQGGESIGYAPLAGQQLLTDYDGTRDCAFFSGESSLVQLEQGMFAIFFPEDLHMPGIGAPEVRVRKVVVKVRV